ncbi:MAG: leishmanolysin-related zinc metalloendopeptidase [Gemmatimonadota bacterium]
MRLRFTGGRALGSKGFMDGRRIGQYLTTLAWATALSACGSTGPESRVTVLHMVAVSPTNPSGVAGTTLAVSPTVQVTDGHGPRPNIEVTFDFQNVFPKTTVLTDAAGEAHVAWELPHQAGPGNSYLVVRGPAGDTVAFRADVLPGPPALLNFILQGNGAVVGTELQDRPVARVGDQYGNAIAGATVKFEVQSGGGAITGAESVSDLEGLARVGGWRLGPSARVQWLLATSEGGLRDSTTGIGIPLRFEALTPLTQRVHTGDAAPILPAVRAFDALGQPMPGVEVELGLFFSSTDSTGTVRLAEWRAGVDSGDYVVDGSTFGRAPIRFTLTAVFPGVARSEIVSGDQQTGLAGNFLGPRPELRVFDSAGAPIYNLPVDWTATGGSSIIKHKTRTDVDGSAATEGWRLGTTPGAQMLTAVFAGAAIGTWTAVATPVPAGQFNLQVRIQGGSVLSAGDSNLVALALARWNRAVLSDLPDVHVAVTDTTFCGAAIDETVDDVLALVWFKGIDGPGGILGEAAPCLLRSDSYLPIVGYIVLDSADVLGQPTDMLLDVMTHELGHVLGIGTLWNLDRLLQMDFLQGGLEYFGPAGRTAFHGLATNSEFFYKPGATIDNSGIPGSDKAHWAELESDYGLELMTPYLSAVNPLSALSVASLRDLGYVTTDLAAEPFSFPAFLRGLGRGSRPHRLLRERQPTRKALAIDPAGQKKTVRR